MVHCAIMHFDYSMAVKTGKLSDKLKVDKMVSHGYNHKQFYTLSLYHNRVTRGKVAVMGESDNTDSFCKYSYCFANVVGEILI